MDLALRSTSRESGPKAGRSTQDGMSLIEVLFASMLFLAISLGVVPMFTQSMVSNSSGNDSSKVSNFARARTEELVQISFNHPDLTIENGSEKTIEEYYSSATGTWRLYPIPSGLTPPWSRTTVVRQYSVDALEDDVVQISEALPAGTDPTFIHLKEIEVSVQQAGGLFTSSPKAITVRTLRAH